jgi:Zn-dependent protease/predicted transcriptional regulator
MRRTFTIATFGSLRVQARWSAIITFFFLLILLGGIYLPDFLPTESRLTRWAVAFLVALLFYGSFIVHELAHCLMARARSLPATTITLGSFGARSDIQDESEGAADELLVALSGPAASATISAIALALQIFLANPSTPLLLVLQGLFLLNLWLGAFNLIPVLPLDGGRALRGALWQLQGDYLRATAGAALVGRALAAAMVITAGILFLSSLETNESSRITVPDWVASSIGAAPLAILLLVSAWFFNRSARNTYRDALVHHRLNSTPVARVMSQDPRVVQPEAPLSSVALLFPRGRGDPAVAVVGEDESLVGLVSYGDLDDVPEAERSYRRAEQVMTPARRIITVSPDDPLQVAVEHMAEGHLNQLPVVVDGHLTGMITRAQVLRYTEDGEAVRR